MVGFATFRVKRLQAKVAVSKIDPLFSTWLPYNYDKAYTLLGYNFLTIYRKDLHFKTNFLIYSFCDIILFSRLLQV